MDKDKRSVLRSMLFRDVFFDYPMSRMTTYKAGGSADAVCFVREMKVLLGLVRYFRKENINFIVIGKGSNVLVKDGGIRGAVIVLKDKLALAGHDEEKLSAGAGITIAELLNYCKKNGLSGLEFMAGIPGTLGGALFMNAGAHGCEIGSLVKRIHMIDTDGLEDTIEGSEISFSYRSSSFRPGTIICHADMIIRKGEKEVIAKDIRDRIKKRKEAQPYDYPSAGSVFKNPPGYYAGRLIDEAGLKGEKIGGAAVSPKHGNFIVNTGNAKASDITALIDLVKTRVKEKTGIDLETEIKILGEEA